MTVVSKPCCIESIPGDTSRVRVLIRNIGSFQFVNVADNGKIKSLGKAKVGKAPKQVAFFPATK